MKPHEIKELRKEKYLSQTNFGNLLGVKTSTVSAWESGDRNPSGGALKMLEDIKNGDLIITEISDLEMKLLDQNVEVGQFESREEYLTESLKYLLVNKTFMPIDYKKGLSIAAEQPAQYKAENNIIHPEQEIEKNKNGGEANTNR